MYEQWTYDMVVCWYCGYRAVSAHPVDMLVEQFECPKCRLMTMTYEDDDEDPVMFLA